MNYTFLKNEKGFSITELIVALGISAVLSVFLISGSIFIKNYLIQHTKSNKLFEELSNIQDELAENIYNCHDIDLNSDSLTCIFFDGSKTIYNWSGKTFKKNGFRLLSQDYSIDSLVVEKINLQSKSDSAILNSDILESKSGVYRLYIRISDNKISDSLETWIVNSYEKFKFN